MSAIYAPVFRGDQQLRFPNNLPAAPQPKIRVAVFGSFMGGYHVLQELLLGPLAERVSVVGVATDDPTQPFIHAARRLWKYPHLPEEETMTPRFAQEHGLPVFTGRVKTPEFYGMLLDEWQPQLCLMATFGQKIPTPLINYPRLGFYNFHHSGFMPHPVLCRMVSGFAD